MASWRRSGASLEEIEAVYRARFGAFARAAAAVTGDAETGREAVQEAFARAIVERRRFRGDATVERWLWTIVLNAARAARRRLTTPAELPEPRPNGSEPGLDRDALRALVAELPERQRLALFLRYFADLSYAEIGSVLGVSEGTVAATLHAARNALRIRVREVIAE